MKKILMLLVASLFPLLGWAQSVIRMSVIPEGSAEDVQHRYGLIANYLEGEIKTKVEFIYLRNQDDVVAALIQKKIDLAYVGGFAFVHVQLSSGEGNPIVQRHEDTVYTSVIIANIQAGIEKISDLKNKNFTFGPLISTSGSLMPRYFLREENIAPEKEFRRISYSKGHEITVRAVESGAADAGAMSGEIWKRMVEANKVSEKRVKLIWTSPPFVNDTWMVTGAVEPAMAKKITDAFLKLDSKIPKHKAVLNAQYASRYIKNNADNYVNIEQAARRAGLLGCQPWACERP